jgi:hypothetical protein
MQYPSARQIAEEYLQTITQYHKDNPEKCLSKYCKLWKEYDEFMKHQTDYELKIDQNRDPVQHAVPYETRSDNSSEHEYREWGLL